VNLAQSLEEGPHARLALAVGSWAGAARLWLEPGALAAEDTVTGEVAGVGAGRWVRHDYATRIDGTEHTGSALLGFHIDDRAWQVAWADTFHTGSSIMLSEGPLADDPEAPISVLGSYGPADSDPWGWRTTFDIAASRLLVRHFNITPWGEEGLAVEFDYERR
jgi:hypothetical protein